MKKVQENCENHGVTCVRAYTFDSTKCYASDGGSVDSDPPYKSNMFDKVLLDGPCSGLGQRPQLINKMTPKMLQSYKFVQRKLFDAVSNFYELYYLCVFVSIILQIACENFGFLVFLQYCLFIFM